MPSSTCSTSGCRRPILARGLCGRHYRLARKQRLSELPCRADACGRVPHARGYCSGHYAALRATGQYAPPAVAELPVALRVDSDVYDRLAALAQAEGVLVTRIARRLLIIALEKKTTGAQERGQEVRHGDEKAD